MSIKEIQDKIAKGEYRLSDHAVKMMIKRSIERLLSFPSLDLFKQDQLSQLIRQADYSPASVYP
jgi:hypothetical protein